MVELEKSCCFTGHRPDKLPWGTDESDRRCVRLKEALGQAVEQVYQAGARHFMCGMARGGDLYFAQAVLKLRDRHPEVSIEAVRPCESQADHWPRAEQEQYQRILDCCNYETLIQHHYDRYCMMRRNRYMVDRSAWIIAVYNGEPRGGTAHTLAYALRKKRKTDILDLEDFL